MNEWEYTPHHLRTMASTAQPSRKGYSRKCRGGFTGGDFYSGGTGGLGGYSGEIDK